MGSRYLLDLGLPSQTDSCARCGRHFADPAQSERKFVAALKVFDRRESSQPGLRMLLGSEVLIARTSPELSWRLEHSTTRIGDRVLVAIARVGDALRILLFCARCGAGLAPLVAGRGGDANYSWDWIVSFSRRPLWERSRALLSLRLRLRSRPSRVLAADAQ